MQSLEQLIKSLRDATQPESVSPQSLAEIYDAVIDRLKSDRRELEALISESGGSADVPDDLLQRLEAIGETAANALETASNAFNATSEMSGALDGAVDEAADAKKSASAAVTAAASAKTTADTAKSAAQTAQSTADSAKTAAQTAQSTADSAKTAAQTAQSTADSAKTAAQTAAQTANRIDSEFTHYCDANDSRIEVLEDFRETLVVPKTWCGSAAQYDAVASKDPETLYFITES